MKNTPLTDIHINLGAKMAEFAGYNMPISYAGIKEEHQMMIKVLCKLKKDFRHLNIYLVMITFQIVQLQETKYQL